MSKPVLDNALFQALANAVLGIHVLFVLFVVGGLILIIAGGCLKWHWIRNLWFRLGHLAAIGFVVLESWLGIFCPLTTLELWLRGLAGQTTYEGDFIAFWLRKIIFFEGPPWVFTVVYTVFGAMVILSWVIFPPLRSPRGTKAVQ
jgi:hypothetical protein